MNGERMTLLRIVTTVDKLIKHTHPSKRPVENHRHEADYCRGIMFPRARWPRMETRARHSGLGKARGA